MTGAFPGRTTGRHRPPAPRRRWTTGRRYYPSAKSRRELEIKITWFTTRKVRNLRFFFSVTDGCHGDFSTLLGSGLNLPTICQTSKHDTSLILAFLEWSNEACAVRVVQGVSVSGSSGCVGWLFQLWRCLIWGCLGVQIVVVLLWHSGFEILGLRGERGEQIPLTILSDV